MIARSVMMAFEQLMHPSFRKVFFIGTGLALVLFVALFAGLDFVLPKDMAISDWEWVNDALSWVLGWSILPLLIVVMYLFFPAVSTTLMGPFLDDVVDAVEDQHYADRRATRSLGVVETIGLSAKLGFTIILANILALPFYLILIFTAVGPFILFLLLNSYLLGREYFELVATRHMPQAEAKQMRGRHRDKTFVMGGAITLLFVVPGLNLLAPIIGAAAMTHMFHALRNRG